jgi:hypothetical protein
MMSLLPENAAHWHLVLNHLPVVGSMAALLLLIWAWIKNTDDLKRVALVALALVAIVSIPAFLTGEPAEHLLKGLPGISKRWMSNHEEAAELAVWVAIAVGVAALAALIFFRKKRSLPRWVMGVFLLLCLAVCTIMARTANLGGKIHHPEINTYTSPDPATDVEF